ncbi:MAG TPA: hypothetical protein PKM99_09535 [Thermotogota bacterium]|nr:hypothetical protein [Thermotogota bacterium]NLZ14154.1 hypothetical protein [Thermotogaceae bacterium]MDD8053499.1 hypothetical protein [Thermotogota bacterium]HNR63217.1 hypothetical protein [Thermotogota bacterium]HNT96341.1 hypothetical protein [Thermotogota bacterium]
MTGPLEMQTSLVKPSEAAQSVSRQLITQEAAQQVLASEMLKKTKESTHTTPAAEKTSQEGVKNSTDKEQGQMQGELSGRKKEEEKETPKKPDDDYRGHFLDVRG